MGNAWVASGVALIGFGLMQRPDKLTNQRSARSQTFRQSTREHANRKAIKIKPSVREINKVINDGNNKVIAYLAEWCGYCKQFKPYMNKIASKSNVAFYYVNVGDDRKLANRYKIKGFPTIKFYRGSTGTVHRGPRDVNVLSRAINNTFT